MWTSLGCPYQWKLSGSQIQPLRLPALLTSICDNRLYIEMRYVLIFRTQVDASATSNMEKVQLYVSADEINDSGLNLTNIAVEIEVTKTCVLLQFLIVISL